MSMPSVHATVGAPWAEGSVLHAGAVVMPWGDGATVHAGMSGYTPGPPPDGGVPTHPTAPVPREIAARQTYKTAHVVTVTDLRDDTPLDVLDLSIATDEDSVFWTVRGSGPGSLFDKLVAGEQPAQIEVTIDGQVWRFAIDTLSRSREFGATTASFAGRSLTVAASAPYEVDSNWVNDGVTTAAQTAAIANIYTGLEVVWKIDDWIIPDKIFSFSGTPLGVVRRLAEAVGAIVVSDRSEFRVTVSPRYPILPNEWPVSPPDVQIALDAVQAETYERADRPEYDGVYVSGQQGGVVGFVRLEGRAGATLHPLVTDLLLTEEPALRQRGAAILGASGGQARVSLTLPVLTGENEPGVLDLSQLVRVFDPAGTWYGLARSISVTVSSVGADPRVRQVVVLERHTKSMEGTYVPPEVVVVPPGVAEWHVEAGDPIGAAYYAGSAVAYDVELPVKCLSVERDGEDYSAPAATAEPRFDPPTAVAWFPVGGGEFAFAPVGGNTSVWGLVGGGEAPVLERVSGHEWRVTMGTLDYTVGTTQAFGELHIFGENPCHRLTVTLSTYVDDETPNIAGVQSELCW
jgi:hypothetical protein